MHRYPYYVNEIKDVAIRIISLPGRMLIRVAIRLVDIFQIPAGSIIMKLLDYLDRYTCMNHVHISNANYLNQNEDKFTE